MSGSRVQHLQRSLGIFYLRVRVPNDIRSLLGLTEVRRSLHTYKPSRARTLCAVYALIAEGRLETRKIGKRTVIPAASLAKLLEV